jgi:2-polyprenyl-6-hydroxyphenyl methylase/3-demethylubiquinone-9 3-methyltransferase
MSFRIARGVTGTHYIAPHVIESAGPVGPGTRVLDVGCGTGHWAAHFAARGCQAVGIDPSATGIEIGRAAHPEVRFEQTEATEDLLGVLGEKPFDLVISTEVVEHLYDPPGWATGCYKALRPGGLLIASTPYHGWLKNVVIALAGKSDFHHDALRVGGHIKFFSKRTLHTLLSDAGFTDIRFRGAGRMRYMWCSTIVAARRPR